MPRSRKLHTSEQIISWGYGLINTKPIKLITFSLTKVIRFIRSLSLVQFVAPRQIRAKIIYLRVDFLDRMRMAVEKPDLPVFSYTFQGIFNATVFSELTHHTKTKMIIFTIGPLQGFRLLRGRNHF